MNFRTSVQTAAIVLILSTSTGAQAGLGGLSLPSLGGSSGASVDVDGFLKNASIAETLMRSSLDQMASSLASKEEIAQIDALKKQASEKTDAKEKGAIEQEIVKSQAALLAAKDFDKIANDDIKKMDAKQKQKLAGAASNFILASLKDKEMVSQSSGVISGLGGNPANLSKLGTVKDVAVSLKIQLELAANLITKVPKIFSAVGVKNPPTKASDAPVATTGD